MMTKSSDYSIKLNSSPLGEDEESSMGMLKVGSTPRTGDAVSPPSKSRGLSPMRRNAVLAVGKEPVVGVSKGKSALRETETSSSSSDSHNNRPPKEALKVSFEVDDKGAILEHQDDTPVVDFFEDDEVWWSHEELDALLTEAMLVAEHFTMQRHDWQDIIVSMLKTLKNRDKGEQPTPLNASDLDFVVDSEARGIELYIHPIFQKNRVKAIKGVVDIQKQLYAREKKTGKVDLEFRLKALRNQSMKLTLPARLMAKTLADGDRRVADADEEESS